MTPSVFDILRKRLSFEGRAPASECGLVIGVNLMAGLVLAVGLDQVFGLFVKGGLDAGPLATVFLGTAVLPSMAPVVRRLHDTGRSGAWVLLAFTGPLALILLVMLSETGDEGPNVYGAVVA